MEALEMTEETLTPGEISVPKSVWTLIEILIRGTAHLICNNWKTKHGEARESRTNPDIFGARSPEDQFADALYTVEGRENWSAAKIGKYGMPAYFVRSACISAAKKLKDWDLLKAVRGGFFTEDVIAPITEVQPMRRRDIVTVNVRDGRKKSVPKYRAQFDEGWEMTVPAKIDTDILPTAQLAVLLSHAGTSTGIGEWRPERGGRHGRFKVLEINELR
jgi:hypothetical protein